MLPTLTQELNEFAKIVLMGPTEMTHLITIIRSGRGAVVEWLERLAAVVRKVAGSCSGSGQKTGKFSLSTQQRTGI